MTKPLTVARHDFEKDIKKIIEEAELPAFAIADILQDMILRVTPMIEAQYQEDLKNMTSEEKE